MKFEDIELPSNRKFGFFFAGLGAVAALYFAWHSNEAIATGLALLSAAFGASAVVKPDILLPLNQLWMRFGFLLGKIISPIVLGILFFLLITPIALCMRIAGRDELRLKPQQRKNHWKERSPIGPDGDSFKNQF